MKYSCICFIIILILSFTPESKTKGIYEASFKDFPKYGVPIDGFPNYDERVSRAIINIARVDPDYYRRNFMIPFMAANSSDNIFLPSNYPPVPPLYWNYNLNRVNRAHSFDILNNCITTSKSLSLDCNGTTAISRMKNYYQTINGTRSMYTRVYKFEDCFHYTGKKFFPLIGVVKILCGGDSSSCGLALSCPTDDTNPVGRSTIMNKAYIESGTGLLWDGNGFSSTTLSSNESPYTPKPYIIDGVQIYFNRSDPNSFRFHCIVYTPVNVTNIDFLQVIINETPYNMTLTGNNEKQGLYVSEDFSIENTNCSSYFFLLYYDQFYTERYPSYGKYIISDSTCKKEWINKSSLVHSFTGNSTRHKRSVSFHSSTPSYFLLFCIFSIFIVSMLLNMDKSECIKFFVEQQHVE